MRVFRVTAIVLSILIIAFWSGRSLYVSQSSRQLVNLLQHRQLSEARAKLNSYHDWHDVLRRIEGSKNTDLAQAALDVQFEYWYSENDDTNYPYPEQIEVIRRLLSLGARPKFDHLLRATQQSKMESARLFLDASVPVQQQNASDTPLANAAYWGDIDLIKRLLKHGADINNPSAGGWRPILAAAWTGKDDCVRYLLDNGADVSLPYKVWEGNVQPIWKVIEERALMGSEFSNVWVIIQQRIPNR